MSMKENIKNVVAFDLKTMMVIGVVLLQTLAFGVYAGTLRSEVIANTDWIEKNGTVSERLGRLEEGQTWIKDALKRLLTSKGK